MKASFFLVFLCLTVFSGIVVGDNGGGEACGICTAILQLVLNLMDLHTDRFDTALLNYCTTLPPRYANGCIAFAETYGDQLIDYIAVNASSDQACRALGVCTDPTCNLFPGHSTLFSKPAEERQFQLDPTFNLEEMNAWSWLLNAINKWTALHVPAFDKDGDYFSASTDEVRGAHWRGRDCNGKNNAIYPGRKFSDYSDSIDQDCNGIYGSDSSGNSYEDMYCANSDRRGYIGLGDSATAHFRIPPEWLNATDIHRGTYSTFRTIGFDEFDWPYRSWGTGHLNDTTGQCPGPMQSVYQLLYQRNRCNFRDYQNIGVNGARTSSMKPPNGIINSMARNQTNDYPALVFFALIGNDVCNGHPNFDHMTTVPDFKQNVLDSLNYLDTVLPADSHIVLMGLAQGEFLWNTMNQREYVIGGTTYADMYNYLNCLEISPCWGWMNSDPVIRANTSLRARELSAVYEEIIRDYTFNNFDMIYMKFPLAEIAQVYIGRGGQPYELIEPVDGFHPSQTANALLAEYIFEYLTNNHPSFLGKVNPHNHDIQLMFGDQGGY